VRFADSLFRNALLATAFLGLSLAGTAGARAEALLLMEADSGKVLHAENATQPWYPASVTKLMTAYVTLKAVKERRLTLDTLLDVSANATAQAPSKMGFKPGTQVTVDNALKMLMVKSANDVAVVLAEGISGSIEKFADDMNRAARRLGMVQTTYVNPNGLPADAQVTSARDLGILARAIIRELPEYELYWRISAIKFGKRVMRNYNTLIDRYPGADGMKTGFICASGFNLVASANRNGRRLIAVVLGAHSGPVRAVKAAQLLERGFNSGGFSWLTPSLGSVDALVPVNATPPNLRDEMCGKHRKRPAAESEDADDDEPVNAQIDSGSPHAINLANLRGSIAKPSTLLGPLTPSMEPIVVFAGAPKKAPATQVATPAAQPKKKPAAPAAAQPATLTTPAFAATPPAYPTTNAFTPPPAAANAKPAAAPAAPKPKSTIAAAKPQDKSQDKPQQKPAEKKKPAAAGTPSAKPTVEATANSATRPAAKPAVQ
jgi:D-alanyl-D-alanine carboxypeptidase